MNQSYFNSRYIPWSKCCLASCTHSETSTFLSLKNRQAAETKIQKLMKWQVILCKQINIILISLSPRCSTQTVCVWCCLIIHSAVMWIRNSPALLSLLLFYFHELRYTHLHTKQYDRKQKYSLWALQNSIASVLKTWETFHTLTFHTVYFWKTKNSIWILMKNSSI